MAKFTRHGKICVGRIWLAQQCTGDGWGCSPMGQAQSVEGKAGLGGAGLGAGAERADAEEANAR